MQRILTTTAIIALAAAPAFAQSDASDDTQTGAKQSAEMSQQSNGSNAQSDVTTNVNGMDIRATDLIGKSVYIRSEDASDLEIADSIGAPADGWNNVGEIGDVVLSKDGEIDSVTLNAGGFLGVGEKQVSTSMDELKMVSEEGTDGEYFVVFTGDRSALEERDMVDRDGMRDEGYSFFADNEQTEGRTTRPVEKLTKEVQDADAQQTTGMMSDDQRNAVTAEEIEGVAVYDASNAHVGEISNAVLTDDGRVSDVVIDVGGFLGLGEKPVAIPFDKIELRRDNDEMSESLRATTELTVEEFESMKAWKG
ncbi:PRC-barrel domain-containing protein [uncultured Roseovarius sp.]|uniref:PRC-barrel domain-containing protein n=1 Tax=uncultured Roseovarius sp. TaxID=293344 RepID=UPI00260E30C2|nr:PRC-barrel domain-containing protein [uncultured Roseovarius sp.]